MKRVLMTALALAICVASVAADVTIKTTMTMEGPMAQAMGGSMVPLMTQRIKGLKSRSDIEVMGQSTSAIVDLASRQVLILLHGTRTAQLVTPEGVGAGTAAALPDLKLDFDVKPTGKTQTIDGQACVEHAFTLALDMASMGGAEAPAEAAAAMKDVKMVMNGSIWAAKDVPGAAELAAFNKAAAEANLLAAVSGLKPGQSGGMDQMLAAAASAPGIPYLMEITMTFEGAGPMVEMMKQMGPIKMVQKVNAVSTEAISDDVFKLPEGYTIQK